MTLTALGFVAVFVGGLFLAFAKHPSFGLWTYFFVFYNPPATRWWGAGLPEFRWALYAGIVTLLAMLFYPSEKERPPWYSSFGATLLIMFVLLLWAQTLWTINLPLQIEGGITFSKYVILFFLIYALVKSEKDFDTFLLVNVLGGFIFGWIAYQDGGGGRFEQVGASGINDANSLGTHFSVLLALGGFLFFKLKEWDWKKWIVLGSLPFIMNGLVLTGSRGAFVGLLCGGVVAFVLVPAARRKALIGFGGLGLVLMLLLGHNTFWDRMQSILGDEQGQLDHSAASRMDLAKYGWEMFKDYPMGAGYRAYEDLSYSYVPQEFLPRSGMEGRAAHTTIVAVLVGQGIWGVSIFIGLWVWAGWKLMQVKFLDPLGLNESLGLYRAGLGSALTVILVAGIFHNFEKLESVIWLYALVGVLGVLCKQSLQQSSEEIDVGRTPQEMLHKRG